MELLFSDVVNGVPVVGPSVGAFQVAAKELFVKFCFFEV
jgi:hypothetical protein